MRHWSPANPWKSELTHVAGLRVNGMSLDAGQPRFRVVGALVAAALILVGCANQDGVRQDAAISPTSPTPSASNSPPTDAGFPAAPPPAAVLRGDHRNAIVYAPLDDPDAIGQFGSVPKERSQAWSTSKVLVILALIQEVAEGDPSRLSPEQKRLIELALTESDLEALLAIRSQIPGGSGRPMTEIIRSVGDQETVAPDSNEGSMPWTIRNQVKFLVALHAGKVVSRAASKYVVDGMHPVESESWGLGTVGADAFKGGWLTADTDTRQMGFLDGFAVAIITDGVGPAALQIDGDQAHVKQMNRLARLLKEQLRYEGQGVN